VTTAIDPEGYYRGNVRATANLARASAITGARFVLVSSLAACGPCAGGDAVNEETAPAPVGDYGKSKLEGELEARALIPEAVIVRPPVVYGPRDTGVYGILKAISRGIAPRIGGGERWFSMVYVDDLVDGLLAAAGAPGAAGRTYFIAHPEPVNWTILPAIAGRIMGRKPRTVTVPLPAAYALGFAGELLSRVTGKAGFLSRGKIREAVCERWVCDPSRAAAELGVRPQTNLEAGLKRTLAWYKEAGWLKY
jgi:nucleoside-diphosphate-sugar epimerase